MGLPSALRQWACRCRISARRLSIVGLSLERAFLTLVGEDNAHHVTKMADAYRASKIARREQGIDHDPLYPGARAALDRLSARDDGAARHCHR